jgi:hypothetical protein
MWTRERHPKKRKALVTLQRKMPSLVIPELFICVIFYCRVEKFSMLLQSRLKNSIAIFVKVSCHQDLHSFKQSLLRSPSLFVSRSSLSFLAKNLMLL